MIGAERRRRACADDARGSPSSSSASSCAGTYASSMARSARFCSTRSLRPALAANSSASSRLRISRRTICTSSASASAAPRLSTFRFFAAVMTPRRTYDALHLARLHGRRQVLRELLLGECRTARYRSGRTWVVKPIGCGAETCEPPRIPRSRRAAPKPWQVPVHHERPDATSRTGSPASLTSCRRVASASPAVATARRHASMPRWARARRSTSSSPRACEACDAALPRRTPARALRAPAGPRLRLLAALLRSLRRPRPARASGVPRLRRAPAGLRTARAPDCISRPGPAQSARAAVQRPQVPRRAASRATLGAAAGRASSYRPTRRPVVVPVPLHLTRLRARGYNQAAAPRARASRAPPRPGGRGRARSFACARRTSQAGSRRRRAPREPARRLRRPHAAACAGRHHRPRRRRAHHRRHRRRVRRARCAPPARARVDVYTAGRTP